MENIIQNIFKVQPIQNMSLELTEKTIFSQHIIQEKEVNAISHRDAIAKRNLCLTRALNKCPC